MCPVNGFWGYHLYSADAFETLLTCCCPIISALLASLVNLAPGDIIQSREQNYSIVH